MEDHREMDPDSTSNVVMVVVHGIFIPATTDGTVTEARHSR